MDLPMPLLSDSYKASHYKSYPDSTEMIAYGEFRRGFDKDTTDTRVLFYGLRYILETHLLRKWTVQDVERASAFFKSHLAPTQGQFEFPKHLFLDFIEEFNGGEAAARLKWEKCPGYFPIKLQALPEGTVIHARVPVYQITASSKYAPLCTYLETVLTMVWYQTTVATLSRRARDVIEAAFEKSVDAGRDSPLIQSRLHDFGMRGCTCIEQSVLGGVAHFLSFEGSDTMSAGYYAQFHLNEGRPVSSSIPATEHSVMTAWPTERQAILNMVENYGEGIFACVMDSYDYSKALSEVLPTVAQQKVEKGGFMVLRPDSGDPVKTVLMALEAAEKVFGVDTNSKGYKTPRGCGVIQGDAVTMQSLKEILGAVLENGYSAQAVAFGMGSGLLQKVNRDTLSFATKLSHIRIMAVVQKRLQSDYANAVSLPDAQASHIAVLTKKLRGGHKDPRGVMWNQEYVDGTDTDIMKHPTTGGKDSFPGALAVKRVDGVATVFPRDGVAVSPQEDLLQTVYDHGPVQVEWETFDALRERVRKEWKSQPPTADVISPQLMEKTKAAIRHLGGQL